jgi:hypothetical protein
MPRLPFMIGSYNGRSSQWNDSRCVNLFPELAAGGKSQVALIGCPGVEQTLQISTGTAPVFLVVPIGDNLFAFNATRVTKVEYDTTASAWGTQTNSLLGTTLTTTPTFAENRDYILLDSGVLVDTDTLAVTSGMTFGWGVADTCQCVAYLDGYFIAVPTNSQYFYISAILDPTSWHSLDYASAESEADRIVRVIPFRRELWLFGERSTEVWYNSGDPDFPFARNPSAHINIGLVNKRCIARVGDTIIWLGIDARGSGEVYMAEGYSPVKISNPVIDYNINKCRRDFSVAHAFSYKMSGHDFFVLVFPNTGTWVYDATMNEWHEWLDGSDLAPLKVRSYCFYKDMHLVASRSALTNNAIGELSLDTYTMWTQPIKRLKISPLVAGERERIFHNKFEADLHLEDAGTVSLRYSDDGGNTWCDSKDISITAGDYKKRFRWHRLGHSRSRMYELSTTSEMRTLWIDAFLEFRGGAT